MSQYGYMAGALEEHMNLFQTALREKEMLLEAIQKKISSFENSLLYFFSYSFAIFLSKKERRLRQQKQFLLIMVNGYAAMLEIISKEKVDSSDAKSLGALSAFLIALIKDNETKILEFLGKHYRFPEKTLLTNLTIGTAFWEPYLPPKVSSKRLT